MFSTRREILRKFGVSAIVAPFTGVFSHFSFKASVASIDPKDGPHETIGHILYDGPLHRKFFRDFREICESDRSLPRPGDCSLWVFDWGPEGGRKFISVGEYVDMGVRGVVGPNKNRGVRDYVWLPLKDREIHVFESMAIYRIPTSPRAHRILKDSKWLRRQDDFVTLC